MSLSQGSQIDWTDIQSVYERLNTQRQRFGFTAKTIGDNAGVRATTTDVTNLKDAIQEMTSHSQLTTVASTSGVTVPNVGDLLTTSPYTQMDEIVTRMSTVAVNGSNYGYCGSYNSSYYTSDGEYATDVDYPEYTLVLYHKHSSYKTYGSNSSNYDYTYNTVFSGNYGYCYNNYGSNYSHNGSNYTWQSGNYSHNGSCYSYDSSNYGSNYSWQSGNYSHNGSNYGSNNSWNSGNYSHRRR